MPKQVKITGDLYHPVVPDGAVRVTRPTRWGNPHPVDKPCDLCDGEVHSNGEAVLYFQRDLLAGTLPRYPSVDEIKQELKGKDLACWCEMWEPCHADVLLRIANVDD